MLRQPSCQHVDQLAEVHRNALEVLKKIADCCCKEAAAWTANVQALAKAKQDEEKALARENQKEEKRAAQAEKKKREKILKAAKARADKAEKERMAEEGGGDQADVEEAAAQGKSKKTRNRNRSGTQELTEDDPELLHAMFKLPLGAMAVANDVASFVDQIAEVPGAACIARLRRGPFKKEDDSLNPSDCNAMQKVLVQESQSFVQQVEELYKAPNAKWDARATSIADGPALMLAMDDKIAQRLQQLSVEHQDRCDVPRVNVLDRDHLGKEIYDEAIRNQRDAEAAMKEMRRMTGVAWVGAKHGGVFTGNLPVPGAAFLYQIEGQRIVACAPAMELLGMMHTHDAAALPDEINAEMAPEMIKDIMRFLQTAREDFLRENLPVNFRYECIIPGDVLYVPAGSIVMEKSVVANNVILRVPSPLLSSTAIESVIFTSGIAPKSLGIEH
ncbi:unnamed protein product [Cladocopium goreaui]|uniref:Uncharacterized protein n=1 Tax=Cladocopium goreaui TaxID=2562237 RepID=A0A9P1DWV8_9DINO|nr:unnamed protein product [Cladocopium goreaui]